MFNMQVSNQSDIETEITSALTGSHWSPPVLVESEEETSSIVPLPGNNVVKSEDELEEEDEFGYSWSM